MRTADFADRVQINTRDFEQLRNAGIELYNLGGKAASMLQGTAIQVCSGRFTVTDYYAMLHDYVQTLEDIMKKIEETHDRVYDKLPMSYKQETLL